MSWLLAHIRRRRRRIEETIEVAAEEQAGIESKLPECSRPRLALLVQDAAGPAAYQLHTFEDAASAAAFIEFWFPPQFDHGIRAFWTAHEEPARQGDSSEERPPEAVILVRDEDRRDIVYPFSCSDMGQARSWIAMEATRGLDLRLVLLYWAVPVRIEADGWGAVLLSPSEAPARRDRKEAEAGFEARPALQGVEEEVEEAGAGVGWFNRLTLEEVHAESREEAGTAVPLNAVALEEVQAEPREEAGTVDLEPVEEPVVDAPLNAVALEEVHAESREEAGTAVPLNAVALEEVRAEPREEAGTVTAEPIERDGNQDQVREVEGMAEVSAEDEEAGEGFLQGDAPREAEDGDTADESAWGLEEIPSELANLLKVRRWRRSEGPFKGFGSPEGKF